LKSIFKSAFAKSPARSDELPIERAIAELCGLIQCNQVMVFDTNDTERKIARYDLEINPNFVLEYCPICIQMTNHINGVCQKCKK
jgi:hypothetical protein